MENIQDLVDEAKSTTSISRQEELLLHPATVVRKSLASNPNTSKEILEKLCYDTTVNVSYVAVNNRNTYITREFRQEDKKHKCILCTHDLVDINNCKKC